MPTDTLFDPGLEQIDDFERRMIAAHDERWASYNIPAEEVARVRPGVVQLAKTICDRLRQEYTARSQR